MGGEIVGFLGAAMAALFFGSNYVPTKNYPTGDGFSFVWSFSAGVFLVGISTMFYAHTALIYAGLLGGSLWATGNLCVIPIVKTIGLGPGMLIWGSTSLLTGFLTGKLGLFGLEKQSVSRPVLNWCSIIFIVGSMIVFFFVKPTLDKREDYDTLPGDEEYNPKKGKSIQDPAAQESETSIWDKIPTKYKGVFGGVLSIISGMLYGVNMLPMSLWQQKSPHDRFWYQFIFSHFCGIYLYSNIVFIIYCLFNKFMYGRAPAMFPAAVFPSMISGAMWGIAQCGLMSATSVLGYAVGFPIGSAGPIIVSSLWSVLYFREIRGLRNLLFLGGSFALLFTGIILLAVSK